MSDDMNPEVCTIASSGGVVLEAVVDHRTTAGPSSGVAVIGHPHPQFGGDMHNNVVAAIRRGLADAGVASVRFNFRGVGASSGSSAAGPAARDDYLAALDAAIMVEPDAPLYACGYSFGADVALTCTHPAITMWIVVAPPLRSFADDQYATALDARPKHVLAGVHDQFASPDAVRAATAGWRNVHVHPVEMADHFFAGATARVAGIVQAIVRGELRDER